MGLVYLGTSEFAAEILAGLAGSGDRVPALVLTRPDRPSGRGRRMQAPPVALRARELGIPLEQPESVNSPEAQDAIAAAAASPGEPAVVVCAFGALIREPLLSAHEILNVHPSLLPRWRGAAPVERAIMAGDERTGVSIMRLVEGLDSGPVCLAAEEPVLAHDDYASLSARLCALGAELLLRALREHPPFREQPEEGVTYAEKITAEDRLLDPAGPAGELERRVRALTPHIGARAALADGTLIGVHRAALAAPDLAAAAAQAGRPDSAAGGSAQAEEDRRGPVELEGRLLLPCAEGALELLVVQPPGGRPMDAADYLRGRQERT